jgi:hypothetical protein
MLLADRAAGGNRAMRTTQGLVATFAFVSFMGLQSLSAQVAPAPPRAEPSPVPTQAGAQKPETAKGELQSVDPEKKTITLAGGQVFKYDDSTKVTGAQKGVEGLATMSGRQVIVTYNMKGADRIASSIDVAASADRPAPGGPAPGAPAPDKK